METQTNTNSQQPAQLEAAIMSKLDSIEKLTLLAAKPILSVEEASIYTDITVRQLYRLTQQGKIPYTKPGGKRIYFDKDDLTAYLKQNRVNSRDEAEQEAATYTLTGRHKKAREE